MLKCTLEINKIINLTKLRWINCKLEIPKRLLFPEYVDLPKRIQILSRYSAS